MKSLLLGLGLLVLAVSPAFADQKKTEDGAKETPITKWISAENAMLDSMPKTNQEVFFVLRNKHSVIRSIHIVHDDISNAVQACGKENADIKEPMQTRFKQWESAVIPILTEADKFLKIELKEQKAFYASDYNLVMALNDKAYAFSESKIEKRPATSKEACAGLLKSMDATEDKLVGLLQNILLPEEVVRERLKQEKEAGNKS